MDTIYARFNQVQLEALLMRCFTFIASLFVIDIIVGFNGRLLIINGIAIRMYLYVAVATVILLMLIHAVSLNRLNLLRKSAANSLLRITKPIDYAIAAFIALNAVWIFIVPSITGYGVTMAMKQTVAMSMLLLYFPLIILIRLGYISWEKCHYLVKRCLLVLAGIHLYLYVGEKIYDNATFAITFFEVFNTLTMDNSIRPIVMYPKHYVKIIYPSSLFLTAMFYYVISSKLSWKSACYYLIGLSALLTTLTKSLWFGFAAGMLFVILLSVSNKQRIIVSYRRILTYLMIGIVAIIVLNSVLLNNYVFTRAANSFAVQSGPQVAANSGAAPLNEREQRIADELAGTERANLTRVTQTKALLEKWKQSPWFGFGYGSHADNYLRSSTSNPYLYEMLLPSFLMHVGIVGLVVWMSFFIYIFYSLYCRYKANPRNIVGIAYILISLFVVAQFNPFLFGTSSMSLLLFSFIQMQQQQRDEAV